MFGAIMGDMVGAPYEFGVEYKRKDFPFLTGESRFTDDSVMTVAIADALMSIPKDADEKTVKTAVIKSMRGWGRKYPFVGYGASFSNWLASKNPQPYGSWGNGAAMRISSVGWLYDSLPRTLEVAKWVTEVTHNHPEAIKGAQCIAEAIYMARTKKISHRTKASMKKRLARKYGYDFNRTCDEIRPEHGFDVSCQGTVPEALISFFEANSYEDAVRNAVSLGGDTDTLGCITGSVADAYWGIPTPLFANAYNRLPFSIRKVITGFFLMVEEYETI